MGIFAPALTYLLKASSVNVRGGQQLVLA